MNKLVKFVFATMIPLAIAAPVTAKTVLKAEDVCFKVGVAQPGNWQETLKIRPEQALTDKLGVVVHVVALVHGSKGHEPTSSYFNQLAGAAAFNPVPGQVQISLIGNSVGTGLDAYEGIRGIWWDNYAVNLPPFGAGGLRLLIGYESFKPTAKGHENNPTVLTTKEESLVEIPCKDF